VTGFWYNSIEPTKKEKNKMKTHAFKKLIVGTLFLSGMLFQAEAKMVNPAAQGKLTVMSPGIQKVKSSKAKPKPQQVAKPTYRDFLKSPLAVFKHQAKTMPKATYAKGEAIVLLKKGVSPKVFSSTLSQYGIAVTKEFTSLSSSSKGSFVLVKGTKSTRSLFKILRKNPNVQSVSPNYIRSMQGVPNDPKFGDLWGLRNTGQTVNGIAGAMTAISMRMRHGIPKKALRMSW
jgi:hypothetical protein